MAVRNCETCMRCWLDESVGDRECTWQDFMDEDEIEKYYANMEDGCPYYKAGEGEVKVGYSF